MNQSKLHSPELINSANLMILPTLDCPASCDYCFGPHSGGEAMSLETLEAVIQWQKKFYNSNSLFVTFHGGEPLMAGLDFYKTALPMLYEGIAPRKVGFAVQSNLWLLKKEFCELFNKHNVHISTSLDGPETINDAQRGKGYFQKTLKGIRIARESGIDAGCICTFTSKSAEKYKDVLDFFYHENLRFNIHAAVQPIGHSDNDNTLSPKEYGDLLISVFDQYKKSYPNNSIGSIDSMCRSVLSGSSNTCTFTDCLGHYLAVDPHGWIYPCQRLAGLDAFRLGNVYDCPTREELEKSKCWLAFKQREERIEESCGECIHLSYCRGGCPYNVLSANNGRLDCELRDPYCETYRWMFDNIIEHSIAEVFSEQNIKGVSANRNEENDILQKGTLLQIIRDKKYSNELKRHARRTLIAVAFATNRTPEISLKRLKTAGVLNGSVDMLSIVEEVQSCINTSSQKYLHNAYLTLLMPAI
jgi:uncharacterized protein